MQTDVKPDDVPPPLAVAYYADTTPSMLPVVRGIGVLCIVFGGIGIVLLLGTSGFDQYQPSRVFRYNRLYWITLIAGQCLKLVLGVLSIVAGCGLLRRQPRGRRLLLTCVWVALAWTGYAIAYSMWYFVTVYGGSRSGYLIGVMSYQLEYLLPGTSGQLILILLLRNAQIRRIFDDGGAN
jgi:hypothetical protein